MVININAQTSIFLRMKFHALQDLLSLSCKRAKGDGRGRHVLAGIFYMLNDFVRTL